MDWETRGQIQENFCECSSVLGTRKLQYLQKNIREPHRDGSLDRGHPPLCFALLFRYSIAVDNLATITYQRSKRHIQGERQITELQVWTSMAENEVCQAALSEVFRSHWAWVGIVETAREAGIKRKDIKDEQPTIQMNRPGRCW